MDRLRIASHSLENNIRTIKAIHQEVDKSHILWESSQQPVEKDKFSQCIVNIVRQLEFQRTHVQSIIYRLEAVTTMVRDWINLRNAHTMERMTARSILEAHTMRIIALLTLCFLPPTFIAGFLDMGYIDLIVRKGHLRLDVQPGLWLYLAIALPLVLIIMISYILWDRRNVRRAVRNHSHV
ncbi:hypothetical protein CCHR01_02507 [Colletotrichum chrysophilum]|uniref:Uncharacterized protein n=1 Tax=Colletotrichum chrysophilum TaxID=1836956 RepID=A0AAD9AWU1_9PEZI|nr:hypothetical protein CCHR01_02507 [Colletotrichum chrysophilum]